MRCPQCSEPVLPDDQFCGNCGHDLRSVEAPPDEPEQEPGRAGADDDTSVVSELSDVLDSLPDEGAADKSGALASHGTSATAVSTGARDASTGRSRPTGWIIVGVVVALLACICCAATVLLYAVGSMAAPLVHILAAASVATG